jgi:NADH-quinone oxidoreductase subunit H
MRALARRHEVSPFASSTQFWAVILVSAGWVIANINVGVLYIFAISSLGVYGVIMAGWASNSKYPFLAAMRSAAQMVSYEVSIGFVIITVLLCVGSLNLTAIVEAQNTSWGLIGWYWLRLLPKVAMASACPAAHTWGCAAKRLAAAANARASPA